MERNETKKKSLVRNQKVCKSVADNVRLIHVRGLLARSSARPFTDKLRLPAEQALYPLNENLMAEAWLVALQDGPE
jgi:hypothetical protein